METISELAVALFIFCLGFITLTEYFYHVIKNKLKKHHSHPPLSTHGVDTRKEGDKMVFFNNASHPLAFFLITFSLSIVFYNQYYSYLV